MGDSNSLLLDWGGSPDSPLRPVMTRGRAGMLSYTWVAYLGGVEAQVPQVASSDIKGGRGWLVTTRL